MPLPTARDIIEHEKTQTKARLAQVLEAIVETVNEAPNGAPCGPLYMALMHVWPSLSSQTFNMMIAALVSEGKVERRNHCLYRVPPEYNIDGTLNPF